nr:hypothetical transcript [Hymenolepis microstoma]
MQGSNQCGEGEGSRVQLNFYLLTIFPPTFPHKTGCRKGKVGFVGQRRFFKAQAWWAHSCCACPGDVEPGDDFMIFTGGIDDEDLGKRSILYVPANRRGRTL